MPNYEYRCLNCKKRFEVFLTYADYETSLIACTYCGGKNVQRKIGRIRVTRTGTDHLQNMADPANLDALEDDPRALGRMMREMRSELGEEMPAEFDEVVNRLERGHSPEEISQDIPDLSDDSSNSPDFAGGGLDNLEF